MKSDFGLAIYSRIISGFKLIVREASTLQNLTMIQCFYAQRFLPQCTLTVKRLMLVFVSVTRLHLLNPP